MPPSRPIVEHFEIYVRNLPGNCKESDLAALFKGIPIARIRMGSSGAAVDGRRSTFAFLEILGKEHANAAIAIRAPQIHGQP